MLEAPIRRLRRSPTAGLVIAVVAWWLLVGWTVAQTMPTSAVSAKPRPFAVVAGRTAHIRQPGSPYLLVPTERAGYDAFRRDALHSNEAASEDAFAVSEWIPVEHGRSVRIVTVDGGAVQVELLDGPHAGRRAWLRPRDLSP